MLENVKVLVTGGAGFIGSNLVESLLERDNRVVCLDDFSTGRRCNVLPFAGHSGFTLIEGDIRNIDDCRKSLYGVEYVFHLAALGSVPRSVNDPHSTHTVNISGSLNMLIAARDAGVKRFIYASSSSVYGDIPDLPKTEPKTGEPLSTYALSKITLEKYARLFYELYGLESVGLRFFNVFGERQDPEGPYAAVIPRFIKSLLSMTPPEIYGDGLQTRDFTYVGNVIRANHLAAISSLDNCSETVFNIACGEQSSLLELLEILVSELGRENPAIRDLKPVFKPERTGDIKHSYASIMNASRVLGYKPQYFLRDGLARAMSWYRDNLQT